MSAICDNFYALLWEELDMNKITVDLAALLLCGFGANAQQAASPSENSITDAARKLETQMAKNVPAGAEEMPAEKYDFRPTPGQNTFGHLVGHMISANYYLCSAISGAEMPKFNRPDRKITRLNSSHMSISYAVFCLTKKYQAPRVGIS